MRFRTRELAAIPRGDDLDGGVDGQVGKLLELVRYTASFWVRITYLEANLVVTG